MIKVYTLKELVKSAPTKIDMLVEDMLPKVGVAGLIGESDLGKSTLLMQLSMAIAYQNESFLDCEINAVHHRVLYISTEDDVVNLQPRLKMMCEGLEINHDDDAGMDLLIVNQNEMIPVLINQLFKSNKFDLVIIDSFSDLLERDGNSAAGVRRILQPYSNIASAHKCLILILHHIRKSSSSNPNKNDALGSSAFEAKMRCIITLQKGADPDEVLLKIVKANYLPQEIKRKYHALSFKDLIFRAIRSDLDNVQNVTDPSKEADEILEVVIDELGLDIEIKALWELAKEYDYPYGKSKFYTHVKTFKESQEQTKE